MKNITKIEIKEDVVIAQDGKEDILLEAGDVINVFTQDLVEGKKPAKEQEGEEEKDDEEEKKDDDKEVDEKKK